MTAAPHRIAVRVYYEDTDFSGNVYHASYLRFMERGRTEFLRELGIHHSELMAEGIAFAVRAMHIDFIGAAKIDDSLTVATAIQGFTGARLALVQTISRGETPLARAEVVVVAIKVGGGAARMPKALRDRLASRQA